jgi:ubiquitin-like-conjugating enzyme ATG10
MYQQIIPDIYHDQVIISQAEHPLINRPFWYIHPCDTRKLLDAIQFDSVDYVKTWLSFNGPIVKCQVSKDLFIRD